MGSFKEKNCSSPQIVLILRVQATDKELVSYGFMVIPIIGVSTSLFSADGSVATCL